MANQAELNQLLDDIQQDINGLLGVSVVDLETGMALASRSAAPNFDLEAASAYNSEMVKAKTKTIRVLNIQSELEDMLLTLGDQLHLIKMIDAGTFIYVAATRDGMNLALLRSAVNRAAKKLS
ncbi:hypothetical protein [Falsarthrobacter nasiphocae]|uniref:Regulator of Ras-like GTPase activity (Roadblock/LC7/MglB family) n=1 Tax=Falsarthrobacter nasiphocae TaxID=189863 RepID=A0AAE4C5J1_9MICC|nr:hypothetical protein [Falsarthrobacter nasiphocae]MDR6892386.1 putative regulator of Ras-like GTPase activity (Roadblock/LC7/MglB family) [Falsarthrobacter nasiphocae]